ncbi:MAG TPA: phage holin family protein [Gammaproteobacteria bacterium]|nr:phage holin family protein [Gammaproteobacteria bacterium]
MRSFLLRLLIGALSLWLAAAIVPGMQITGIGTLFLAALLLGLVNAVVRPIFILLTLPLTLLTLGLFLLVVNAAMLGLVAAMLDGFSLDGFFPALLGSLIVSLTGWLASRHLVS